MGELANTKAPEFVGFETEQWLEVEPGDERQLSIVTVPVAALKIADSPRSSGENADHLKMLAEMYDQLPPILVHHQTMRVIDGVHRLGAAKVRGQDHIPVQFFYGEEDDAFVLAVKLNVAHGLPLSLGDRKNAAARIISSHRDWSDRIIASIAGLSAKTVAEIRVRSGNESPYGALRIGQDGRVRPVSSAEGRRLASEVIATNPSFSLRQIAKAAGISPETARDVRNRMIRGEDPVPDRRRGKIEEHQAGKGAGPAPLHPSGASWPETVRRLGADPALRLTDNGRILLRLLFMQMVEMKEWEKVAESVPPHCSDIVSELAQECSRIWDDFAEKVRIRAADVTSSN